MSTEEFAALVQRENAKRDAYRLRKLGKEGLWKWQQEALSQLARLRPELARRHGLANKLEHQ